MSNRNSNLRIVLHVALILLTGVGLGLVIRAVRMDRQQTGPGPDDEVYTNEQTGDGLTGAAIAKIENPLPSHPPEDESWLSRFELIERSGRTVKSEELIGQPYVVSFFFSTCPSICVQQNQKLKELQDHYQGQPVRFVAISVDPETDTPEKLREYAARFGADQDQWLFMTGDLTYIRRIGAEIYRQPVDKQFHTERFVLVSPTGEIEGFYSWPDETQFERLKQKIDAFVTSRES